MWMKIASFKYPFFDMNVLYTIVCGLVFVLIADNDIRLVTCFFSISFSYVISFSDENLHMFVNIFATEILTLLLLYQSMLELIKRAERKEKQKWTEDSCMKHILSTLASKNLVKSRYIFCLACSMAKSKGCKMHDMNT